MQRRWAALAPILLALAAPAGAAEERAGAAAEALPPVSMRGSTGPSASEPAPAAIAELLPPGARAPGSLAEWAPASGAGPGGAPNAPAALVEWLERGAAPGEAPERLEVEYTLDRALEERVRELLRQGGVRYGDVLLMDAASGALLAYVSTDPVAFPPTRAYPTASLAKVVTTAALLRRAPKAAERDCRYLGSPYEFGPTSLTPPRVGGVVEPFARALALSNNQCFARLAIGEVGEDALLSEAANAGLLEPPAPGHAAGHFAPVHDALDLGRLGSGLAGSFISPLAAVRLAAALAHGELVRPHWIARVEDAEGRRLALPPANAPQRIWPPELSARLRELLVGVTTEGTASRAFHDPHGAPLLGPVQVAGKTGTLSGRDPAGVYQWFIGVAPADAPRVAIAALVVDGGRDGRASASQIAAGVLHEVFCEGGRCEPGRIELRLAALVPPPEPEPPPLPEGPVAASELDAKLEPVEGGTLEFPRRLRRKKLDGEIVLELELNRAGEVVAARVAESNLPTLEKYVAEQVRRWKFTPPTRGGLPVEARARLPIAITLN